MRLAGLRGAVATCLRSLQALEGAACATSGPPAVAATLADTAPSTSYGEAAPAWQRRWRRGAASAATPPPPAATGRRGQHSATAAAQAVVQAPRPAQYRIEVVTGDVRGAGSPAPAVIKLIGTGERAVGCCGLLGWSRGPCMGAAARGCTCWRIRQRGVVPAAAALLLPLLQGSGRTCRRLLPTKLLLAPIPSHR